MKDLKIFTHGDFKELNVLLDENDNPFFDLADVAWNLGYTRLSKGRLYLRNDRIQQVIKNLDISTVDHGGQLFISESDVYEFIFEAGTDKARSFRKWVTADVLPTIRKTGGYVANDDLFIDTYLPQADDQTKMLLRSTLESMRNLNQQIEEVTQENETLKPKARFADSVEDSEDCVLIRELARMMKQQGIDTGEKRLFAWLRDNGYLIRQEGQSKNLPTQRSADMNLIRIKKSTRTLSDGTTKVQRTPIVTGKGQIYFLNKMDQAI